MVRNVSIGMVALCACVIAWVVMKRIGGKLAASVVAEPKAENLDRIKVELDRNPEAIAKVLALWMERTEPSDRAAA